MPRSIHLLAALLLMFPVSGLAEQDEFIHLFAITCMANIFTPQALQKTLSALPIRQLDVQQAQPFLVGNSGQAWELSFGKGEYAISLTDSGVCSVFARKAPIDAVAADFVTLAGQAPAPLQARPQPPSDAGPNTADLTSISYIWFKPGKRERIVFTLTTSKAAQNPEIQAMASVGLVRKSP